MRKKQPLHAEAAKVRRIYYILTVGLAVTASAVFSLFYFSWQKEENDAIIARIQDTIMKANEGFIRDAVDRTIADIDLERRLVRESLVLKPGDEEGQRLADFMARERMMVRIRETKLRDGGYLWVNEVLDFEGGKDYAIRLVHPFLRETEGMLLSTEASDGGGNFPYRKELEGVKANGSVFNTYYFMKPGEGHPLPKLSYSRLYPDFSWIVGTGIYLDDIDKLVAYERQQAAASMSKQATTSVAGFLLAVTGIVVIVMGVDKVTSKAINASYERILSTEQDLRTEKDKVEAAYAMMKDLAERDQLTGLRNRRSALERLQIEIARAKRSGTPFCLAIADVDRFKLFNDVYGHDTGDLVLKAAAAALENGVRVEDLAARWGGEEFLLLLSGNGIDAALEAAERIRLAVGARTVTVRGEELAVTMTFGVAEYDRNETAEQLIVRADGAMYRGKAAGRNMVLAALPPPG